VELLVGFGFDFDADVDVGLARFRGEGCDWFDGGTWVGVLGFICTVGFGVRGVYVDGGFYMQG
jgi:hypothetical protein